jgi:sRNA-binding protein
MRSEQKRRTMAHYAHEILQIRTAMVLAFPNCFVPKKAAKRPLKIGISKELRDQARALYPQISSKMLSRFIYDYCSGNNYLACIKAGAARVDLNGSLAGFVTPAEAKHAAGELAALEKRQKADKRRQATPAPAAKPETLEEKLARLEHYQFAAAHSDNFYHTSGRKAADDAAIREVKAQLAARKTS